MQDVTRIPRMLSAVQDVWEGQPDLSLGALIGMLENFGVTWGAEDEEALRICRGIARRHPGRVPLRQGKADGLFRIVIAESRTQVFLDGEKVLVVPGEGTPSMWDYRAIRNAQVGYPLVIEDAFGIAHRLGVVERIEPRRTPKRPHEEQPVFYEGADYKAWSLSGRVTAWEVGRRQAKATTLRRNDCDWDAEGRLRGFTAGGTRVTLGDDIRVFACGLEPGPDARE
ncbi:hypothetical protein [Corynebacterium vitaeruminis]|uniref:hypothetical protein n=1 Tax=Corynebacterium vitaeruminis TaxID=38305 RepID=UPI0023F44FD7|nr:hypothetical protein [Corynebacterium vitaeruminis]